MLGRKNFIAQTDRQTTPLLPKFQETCRNKTWKPFYAPFLSIKSIEQNYWSLRYKWNSDKQPVHHRFLQSPALALTFTLSMTLVKFMSFSNIEMVRRNTRWDLVVTIIWIYTTGKPGRFQRNDLFCCWPQSASVWPRMPILSVKPRKDMQRGCDRMLGRNSVP